MIFSSSSMDMNLIPSSSFSSSSNPSQFKHHVFLSFRGEDTRNNFTSHLHKALLSKLINTFIDNNLNRGDEISPALLEAIDTSQISVIVFSENYASSKWCLEELVKILECNKRETNKQIVMPVFYKVDPSEVRHQTGSFAKAFAEHEERFKENLDKVQRWKDALKNATNLAGWHLIDANGNKTEAAHIEDIVNDILKRLNNMSPSDNNDLVGISSKIEKIVSLLHIGEKRVICLGILGMGGIGKTTLAEAVFNKIRSQFEGRHFVPNVREQLSGKSGHDMRQKLLSAILEDDDMNIGTSIVGCTFTRDRLSHKKLLIVFDDVSNFGQIEFLIGIINYLNLESRIIITSKDKQVLNNCGVNEIYEVQELFHYEALELFCRHAFKENRPTMDYKELTDMVTSHVGGVPLALKVLGSHLCGSDIEDWKCAIEELKRNPLKDIDEVLRISYNELDNKEQEIFLDIACFLRGRDIGFIKSYLDACWDNAKRVIDVLVKKCLIVIVSSTNTVTMHDLLQAMGRKIVHQESMENPGKCSRLWHHKDIYYVLEKNKGTKKIKAISLDMSKIKYIKLDKFAFAKMKNLRFLDFHGGKNKVRVSDHVLKCDLSGLIYLRWDACPLKSLPSSLVELNMCGSKLKELWKDVLHLDKLKIIDLRFSNLTICPDFSGFPNLENLNLRYCKYLCKISSSIRYLNKLYYLDLSHCVSLKGVPDCCALNSLIDFNLAYSLSLEMLPKMPCNIEALTVASTEIEELPLSIKHLGRLVSLDLSDCERLKSLPSSICKWKSLASLNLLNCGKLDQLPIDKGLLKSLMFLDASTTGIRELPLSVSALIANLYFDRTEVKDKVHQFLPHMGLPNLTTLVLNYCGITKLPDYLGCFSSLSTLILAGNSFESIPESIINLSRLRILDISYCERLKCLPKLHNEVESIYAYNCTSLEVLACLSSQNGIVSMDSKPLSNMPLCADLSNCFKLDGKILEALLQNAALKRHQADYSKLFGPRLCYPGSEISDWFNFQQMESSIKVELPLKSITIGFVFCVVVAPCPDHQERFSCYFIDWNLQLKSEDGFSNLCEFRGYFSHPAIHHADILKSNHLVMGKYFPKESLTETKEVIFQFQIEYWKKRHKIEKCGVHLISKEEGQNQ